MNPTDPNPLLPCPTPRTDREEFIARIVQPEKQTKVAVVNSAFARQLETELTQAQAEAAAMRGGSGKAA